MQNSSKDFRNKVLGRKGETLTCNYLKRQGYQILKRNYKTPFGEADIVAYRDGVYCFVEVKTRTSDEFGHPAEAVDKNKQRRYRQMAGYFSASLKVEVPIRFDVASVLNGELEYFENAYI